MRHPSTLSLQSLTSTIISNCSSIDSDQKSVVYHYFPFLAGRGRMVQLRTPSPPSTPLNSFGKSLLPWAMSV